jgi:ribose-phosphate pyrophosphokinase
MVDWTIFGGPASTELTGSVCHHLGREPGKAEFGRFPDGEVWVRLEEQVRGREVVVIQSTGPPSERHLFELFALADACRRGAARRILAVIPYLGYARADTRHGRREALMARLVADLLECSGIEQVVTVDAHRPQIEGYFRVPVEHLSAVATLSRALLPHVEPDTVVVSPDLGGARMAAAYGRRLDLPVVILSKHRLSGGEVEVTDRIGEVRGRRCLIVDDMVTTGGTVAEAVRTLSDCGVQTPVTVAASHGLLVADATARLAEVGVERLLVADTVQRAEPDPAWVESVSVAPLLATAIERLITGGSMTELQSEGA